ncbi:hypothetical protein [Pseudoduganella namucuonensis]|uniref:Uncharacterized protein n=1 Tax=Pseudoduganella namucuonensis TaxID=1035707 RepID=A0A1I7F7B1_9BURK|nr:hypothetical protein [Pseudoduganella namucuonensis]SFU32035.1 hypothetical protein SAMN05216552_1001421 [Pseudoduganella namucuonensis]
MSLLNSLKIVTAKCPAPVSPIARRRGMLITKLNEQVAYAEAQQDGGVYGKPQFQDRNSSTRLTE